MQQQQQQQNEAARGSESPEPLRVRSPNSLQQKINSAEKTNFVQVDEDGEDEDEGGADENNDDNGEEETPPMRFNHEPWNWKLNEKNKEEEAELKVAAADEEDADDVTASADGLTPQKAATQQMSAAVESLVV
jgi:hypothetical protein